MTGNDLYDSVAYEASRRLTLRYSSSFGLASRLFGATIRPHIFAVYGMVRIADEIVDTYTGSNRAELLADFHSDVVAAIAGGYSTNPIIHAFALSARRFDIGTGLIDPFFASMATDLNETTFTQAEYDAYIYGSAEVVGLMCLKVFYAENPTGYDAAVPGARALGRAYQKVNFLRDFAADQAERGRIYFPGVTRDAWSDAVKDAIVADIQADFAAARPALLQLPRTSRTSVYVSYRYYTALLTKLEHMSATQILTDRAHVPSIVKFSLLLRAPIEARRR